MKTKKLLIPQGLPLTSIMKYNKPNNYLAYIFATNQPRNYKDLIGLNTNLLSGYFKGKTFGIELRGTVISSDWYLKSLSINPNAYGDNVPAGILDGLLGLFADPRKDYSYSDFWANVKRPFTLTYITHDINGKPLNVPLQATPANVKLWNKGYEEKKERDEQLLIDERNAVTSSRFYLNCKKRKAEAQQLLDQNPFTVVGSIPSDKTVSLTTSNVKIDTNFNSVDISLDDGTQLDQDVQEETEGLSEQEEYSNEPINNPELLKDIENAKKLVAVNCYEYALKAYRKEQQRKKAVPAIGIGLGLFFLG